MSRRFGRRTVVVSVTAFALVASSASAGVATYVSGASGSTAFTRTVSTSGGCTPKQLSIGFENGTASPWTASAGVVSNSASEQPHSGSWYAWLDGYGTSHTDTLSGSMTLPPGCTTYTFAFWLHIDTAETTTTTKYDTLTLELGSTTLATYSNLNHNTGYVQKSLNLAPYAGQSVTLRFTGTEDSSYQTSFVIDDITLNES